MPCSTIHLAPLRITCFNSRSSTLNLAFLTDARGNIQIKLVDKIRGAGP